MTRKTMKLASLLLFALLRANLDAGVPAGFGQLEHPPRMFRAGFDENGIEYVLLGQPATNQKLIFTASNGFFDKGACVAAGKSKLPKVGDEHLIAPNFAYLGRMRTVGTSLRWHVRITRPGNVKFVVRMEVSSAQAGSNMRIAFAGSEVVRTTVARKVGEFQPWNLVFKVTQPGDYTLSCTPTSVKDRVRGVGQLYQVDAHGSAIQGSQLLRTRWRPEAVHGRYNATTGPTLHWIMTTRSMINIANYSPISVPFGYYGTSFLTDRRSNGQLNFSMWAAGDGENLPPLEQMPHLLAAGSREAEFGSFGHEGTGVKIRNWVPMPDRPENAVLSFRARSDGNYSTFIGHFWDHPTRQWKLFAVGRKWAVRPLTDIMPGAFCEVPGRASVERTGDVQREVRRFGWHRDSAGDWQPLNRYNVKSNNLRHKLWRTTEDGAYVMSTGGLRYYRFRPPSPGGYSGPLPEFLTPAATRQLYTLPAEFGEPVVVANKKGTNVRLNLRMNDVGPNASAILYFGETDCLTFAPHDSSALGDRFWQRSTKLKQLKNGNNFIRIRKLTPGTTYFYRMLVINDRGKMWDFDSHQFRTVSN